MTVMAGDVLVVHALQCCVNTFNTKMETARSLEEEGCEVTLECGVHC